MKDGILIKGLKGRDFSVDPKDKLSIKIAMLFEGQCTIGVYEAIKKYGYTEQRYYQLLKLFEQGGSDAIADKKPGSDKKPIRTKELENQIIRMRFLDPHASTDILTQKLCQMGYSVSKRSVERTITEYGLQKKLIR
ncbi:MAG: helix-turn-helix domain-containing protein [Salinivirgaceae bacterium]|jgi:transposase|nr:helix-turn-helix domain-containing protein [Salinivirgaceae bacterium]